MLTFFLTIGISGFMLAWHMDMSLRDERRK